CRSVGDSNNVKLPGSSKAVLRARAAATLDLPLCREQSRSIFDAVERSTADCHGSGGSPAWRISSAGSCRIASSTADCPGRRSAAFSRSCCAWRSIVAVVVMVQPFHLAPQFIQFRGKVQLLERLTSAIEDRQSRGNLDG